MFTEGNQIWRKRTLHGRKRLINEPELFRIAAFEYFQLCENTPILQEDFIGNSAIPVTKKFIRAFTKQGLATYLGFRYYKDIAKLRNVEGFEEVLAEVEQIMFDQKFTAAAVNIFNANLISKDLGISAVIELDDKRKDVADLFPEELRKIADTEE